MSGCDVLLVLRAVLSWFRQGERRAGVGDGGGWWAAALLVCGAFAVFCPGRLLAADHAESVEASGREFITPETQRAIDAGLEYLAARQNEDGSFGSGSMYRRNVAVTGLAGMSLLAAGHLPGRGRYGRTMSRTVDFILAHCEPSGFIVAEDSKSHGPMYGHGFATLFLAEVYGTTPRKEIREKLEKAVVLIVNTQNDEGGWRYFPERADADVSVTVCQMMALRAARNAGLSVPKTTVDRCTEYVKRCQNVDGGFRYQLGRRQQSAFPRSAAAVVALYNAGLFEDPDIQRGLKYLQRYRPQGDALRYESHYFYAHYYAVQAMWHAGGNFWREWYPAVRDELVRRQQPDGGWSDRAICSEYATAMACLVLQTPNNYLPIFQR